MLILGIDGHEKMYFRVTNSHFKKKKRKKRIPIACDCSVAALLLFDQLHISKRAGKKGPFDLFPYRVPVIYGLVRSLHILSAFFDIALFSYRMVLICYWYIALVGYAHAHICMHLVQEEITL